MVPGDDLRECGLPPHLAINVADGSSAHWPDLANAKNRVTAPCTCGRDGHYWFAVICPRQTFTI